MQCASLRCVNESDDKHPLPASDLHSSVEASVRHWLCLRPIVCLSVLWLGLSAPWAANPALAAPQFGAPQALTPVEPADEKSEAPVQPTISLEWTPPVNVVIRRTTGGILQGRIRLLTNLGVQIENPAGQSIDLPKSAIKTLRLPDFSLQFTTKDDSLDETIRKWANLFNEGRSTLHLASEITAGTPGVAHAMPPRVEPGSTQIAEPVAPVESSSSIPPASSQPVSPPVAQGLSTAPSPVGTSPNSSTTTTSSPVSQQAMVAAPSQSSATPPNAWFPSAGNTPAPSTTSGSWSPGSYLVVIMAAGLVGFVVFQSRKA